MYEFDMIDLEGIDIPNPKRIKELEELNEYYTYRLNKLK